MFYILNLKKKYLTIIIKLPNNLKDLLPTPI